jgi:hypothetical protein
VQRILARSWFARHVVLTSWGLIGALIAVVAFLRGAQPIAALGVGAALGGLLVLVPFMYDPFPFPLTREQLPLRLPILRGLARRRHWANPFYVEVLTLRSPLRPSFCAEQLSAALLKFPWFPVQRHNFAGWTKDSRFVLKRLTLWANGMRPTASGRFDDGHPGTTIHLSVAAPAVGAYIFLVFFVVFAAAFLLLAVALGTRPQRSAADLALLVFGMILLTFAVTALFASPIPLPIARAPSEADRYVSFFDEILGADVVSRE